MLIQPPAKVISATECTVVILTKKNCIKEENRIMSNYTPWNKKSRLQKSAIGKIHINSNSFLPDKHLLSVDYIYARGTYIIETLSREFEYTAHRGIIRHIDRTYTGGNECAQLII